MVIRLYVGPPFVKEIYPVPCFRKCSQEPIPVQIKPIMVGPAPRPNFVVFSVVRICNRRKCFVHICPIGMAISAIRIDHRIHQNNHIAHPAFRFFRLRCSNIISSKHCRFTRRRLVTMYIISQMNHQRHFLSCSLFLSG